MATKSVSKATHFSQLSLSRQRLLRLFQRVYFGKVVHVVKRSGEPIFGPGCEAYFEKKFDCVDGGVRPPITTGDFMLKKAHLEFFEEFDRLSDGTAVTVEVRFGLPSRMIRIETFA